MDQAAKAQGETQPKNGKGRRFYVLCFTTLVLAAVGYSILQSGVDKSVFLVHIKRQITYDSHPDWDEETEYEKALYYLDENEDEDAEEPDTGRVEDAELEQLTEKYKRFYDEINASFTPEEGCFMLYHKSHKPCKILRRPSRSAGPYRPDFYILGTRKGGTTSMITHLSKHKFVSSLHIRGLPTDGEVFTSLDDINKYNNRFKRAKSKFIGDSNVQRLVNDARKLAKNRNASRFIVLLRDPIERCYSQCLMRMRNKPRLYSKLLKDLNGVMENDMFSFVKRMKAAGNILNVTLPRKVFRSAVNCWYEGLYYVHLKRLLRYIPKESIRVYWSKDFFESPLLVVRDALKFIGLDPADWDPRTVHTKYNAHSSKDVKREKFSPELVRRMRKIYRPYDIALGQLLGTPVPWLQPEET